VFLVHPKLRRGVDPETGEEDRVVFHVFKPTRIEKIVFRAAAAP
jgi:hypothetical protein